jgi:NAD(P)-dependent dehydrogenase (short-subunit alcohol dehydrogenase family)
LGRAFAQALAAAGAAVAVLARTETQLSETVELIEGAGGTALALPADVTDGRAVQQAIDEVVRRLGPIDLLVNNAGVIAPPQPDWRVDAEAWWRTVEVNLYGAFLCMRAVLPGMVARRHGRIINISSPGAQGRFHGFSAYVVSKAALTALTNNLAFQTREHGVVVLAYAVRFVRTAMSEYIAYSPEVHETMGDRFQRIFEEGRDTPMEEAVSGFMFIASGQADALSGCHLSDWDDLPALAQQAEAIQRDELYMLRLRTLSPV